MATTEAHELVHCRSDETNILFLNYIEEADDLGRGCGSNMCDEAFLGPVQLLRAAFLPSRPPTASLRSKVTLKVKLYEGTSA